jgi:hypothetical protein
MLDFLALGLEFFLRLSAEGSKGTYFIGSEVAIGRVLTVAIVMEVCGALYLREWSCVQRFIYVVIPLCC